MSRFPRPRDSMESLEYEGLHRRPGETTVRVLPCVPRRSIVDPRSAMTRERRLKNHQSLLESDSRVEGDAEGSLFDW